MLNLIVSHLIPVKWHFLFGGLLPFLRTQVVPVLMTHLQKLLLLMLLSFSVLPEVGRLSLRFPSVNLALPPKTNIIMNKASLYYYMLLVYRIITVFYNIGDLKLGKCFFQPLKL